MAKPVIVLISGAFRFRLHFGTCTVFSCSTSGKLDWTVAMLRSSSVLLEDNKRIRPRVFAGGLSTQQPL